MTDQADGATSHHEVESLLHAGSDVRRRVTRFWDGFCDFAVRDNVLEVAVGLM